MNDDALIQKGIFVDCLTNETIERELTADEIAALQGTAPNFTE